MLRILAQEDESKATPTMVVLRVKVHKPMIKLLDLGSAGEDGMAQNEANQHKFAPYVDERSFGIGTLV